MKFEQSKEVTAGKERCNPCFLSLFPYSEQGKASRTSMSRAVPAETVDPDFAMAFSAT